MARIRRKGKVFRLLVGFVLPLLALLAVVLILASTYVAYKVMHPEAATEALDPSAFLLQSFKEFRWKGEGGTDLSGWFVSAKPAAPVIFLCHGYGSNRAKSLSLAERLYAAGFSSAVINLRGHGGASSGMSTLGWLEPQDLLLARQELLRAKLLGQQKLGAWGVDVGAFAVLAAASQEGIFTAIAADTPYLSVSRYLEYRATQFVGGDYALLRRGARMAFSILAVGRTFAPPPSLMAGSLERVQLLVLMSEEEPARVRISEDLLRGLSNQQIVKLPKTRVDDLDGPALELYDRRIAAFFRSVLW